MEYQGGMLEPSKEGKYEIKVNVSSHFMNNVEPFNLRYLNTYIDPPIETTFYTESKSYMPPNSKRQIYTIVNEGNAEEISRLIQLLYKNMADKDIYNKQRFNNFEKLNLINTYFYNNLEDLMIINGNTENSLILLNKDTPEEKSYPSLSRFFDYKISFRDAGQSVILINKLRKHVDTSNFKYYLDWGASYGGLAMKVAKLLNIDLDNIIGVEVDKLSTELHNEYYQKLIKNNQSLFKYIILDKDLHLPEDQVKKYLQDNKFDLITSFMVLHHVQNLDYVLDEIFRMLKPGGYFFIKEHDCWNAIDAMLIDVEHSIYRVLVDKEDIYTDKVFFFRYMNFNTVNTILQNHGFKYVKADFYFATIFDKISPTRAWRGIYQKPKQSEFTSGRSEKPLNKMISRSDEDKNWRKK